MRTKHKQVVIEFNRAIINIIWHSTLKLCQLPYLMYLYNVFTSGPRWMLGLIFCAQILTVIVIVPLLLISIGKTTQSLKTLDGSYWQPVYASPELNVKEEPEEFEDIIESLGSFGHWQRVIFVVICLVDIFGSFSVVIPIFIGGIPNFYAFDSINDTLTGEPTYNETTKNVCPSENNSYTVRIFHDEFTSIVSEVSWICQSSFKVLTTFTSVGCQNRYLFNYQSI